MQESKIVLAKKGCHFNFQLGNTNLALREKKSDDTIMKEKRLKSDFTILYI